jgi:hypothetical protein
MIDSWMKRLVSGAKPLKTEYSRNPVLQILDGAKLRVTLG